ncbi:hypothetical protein [Piscinibacterium candidicorallinum]|uniref:Helix-turn-helix domain-containing protein n=1 Tax=Piscinibacterium candidicorallinum TaxID=1793872 RepID=A0ABV7H0Z9_9BURK
MNANSQTHQDPTRLGSPAVARPLVNLPDHTTTGRPIPSRVNPKDGMRGKRARGRRSNCDGPTFIMLPHVVVESPGYRELTHAARSLLVDLARQFNGKNNGELVACAKALKPLGWTSNQTVSRCLKQLQEVGLIQETRKGAKPNLASLFALTWLDLDYSPKMDIERGAFRRSAYRHYRQSIAATDPRIAV